MPHGAFATIETGTDAGESLDTLLRPILDQFDLPAVAAAAVKDGRLLASGAVGTRRHGADRPVTIGDRFHIGSNTATLTALLAAMFVEADRIDWDSTPADVFPELAATMDPHLRDVTLEQLLSHSSGISGDAYWNLVDQSFHADTGDNLEELRYGIVRQLVTMKLAAKPGTRFDPAPMGYVLVGAMLERLGGHTWEELLAERVFDPLGLRTAGFGPQASLGRVDAPLGHLAFDDRPPKPVLAGPHGDSPLVIGPATTVHMSVLDFAAWAGWAAGQGWRDPALVSPHTMQRMHTPVIETHPHALAPSGAHGAGGFGLGWGMTTLPFAPGRRFVAYSGSNAKNLADIMLLPERDFAMVAMTNISGQKAAAGLRDVARVLYERLGPG
jgi:CubicO group peptidase (beta-lactamase class C family)